MPYLAELSPLELLHLGGLVAGAFGLASFQRREQATEQEMCRDRRRAFAPVSPARGLGDARAQALPSVGCGCGARAVLCERLPLPAQGQRLGRGARLRPRRHLNRQLTDKQLRGGGWYARPCALSCDWRGQACKEVGSATESLGGLEASVSLLSDLGQVTCLPWASLSSAGQ